MLSIQEVEEIFRRQSIMIGTAEGIPVDRADKLFGKDAVDFAVRVKKVGDKDTCNVFTIGDITIVYLTSLGAQYAAGYNNIKEFAERMGRKTANHGNVVAFRPRTKAVKKETRGKIV